MSRVGQREDASTLTCSQARGTSPLFLPRSHFCT